MNKPEEIAKHAYCINDCVCKEYINYVIADGGGRGVLPNEYSPETDYSVP